MGMFFLCFFARNEAITFSNSVSIILTYVSEFASFLAMTLIALLQTEI